MGLTGSWAGSSALPRRRKAAAPPIEVAIARATDVYDFDLDGLALLPRPAPPTSAVIHVELQPEPDDFDERVRQPGLRALARLVEVHGHEDRVPSRELDWPAR